MQDDIVCEVDRLYRSGETTMDLSWHVASFDWSQQYLYVEKIYEGELFGEDMEHQIGNKHIQRDHVQQIQRRDDKLKYHTTGKPKHKCLNVIRPNDEVASWYDG